jgi:hypothetical protein
MDQDKIVALSEIRIEESSANAMKYLEKCSAETVSIFGKLPLLDASGKIEVTLFCYFLLRPLEDSRLVRSLDANVKDWLVVALFRSNLLGQVINEYGQVGVYWIDRHNLFLSNFDENIQESYPSDHYSKLFTTFYSDYSIQEAISSLTAKKHLSDENLKKDELQGIFYDKLIRFERHLPNLRYHFEVSIGSRKPHKLPNMRLKK